jgi:hypothetical protein
MDDLEFKIFVVNKLTSIDDRLATLEEGLTGLTDFASGFIGDEVPGIDAGMLGGLKQTLESLVAPMSSMTEAGAQGSFGSESHEDIISSLSEFRDRISSIRNIMESEPSSGAPEGDGSSEG